MGLGNPGAKFKATRHNVGAQVVETLAKRHAVLLRGPRGIPAICGEARVELKGGTRRLALALPQTFMNDSGIAVAALVSRYGLEDLHRLVIVHDELDLPAGEVRVKLAGGLAGHNGLKSIKAHLHDDGFVRVRVGIGKPPAPSQGINHVLSRPSKAESALLEIAVGTAADAVEAVLEAGPEAAMNRFNARS
ncbi:MAG: aminoacyl-tRNA hydrolase [Actinobacteria bacterium]|nr:aminoacyl-tRNA hydrolase [Actinomycetota bacterium]